MKKGFTLIEVLAVLVILALIAVIAIPNTFKISGNIKKELYCKKVNLVLDDAKRWGTDHISSLQSDCYTAFNVKYLVNNGISKKDSKSKDSLVINPYSNATMDNDKVLLYKKNDRAYAYYIPSSDSDIQLLLNSCDIGVITNYNVCKSYID